MDESSIPAMTNNEDFRRVLYTARSTQLVLMSLKPGEEIGEEIHEDEDQFIRVEAGAGEATIDAVRHRISDGSAVIIPAGARHRAHTNSLCGARGRTAGREFAD